MEIHACGLNMIPSTHEIPLTCGRGAKICQKTCRCCIMSCLICYLPRLHFRGVLQRVNVGVAVSLPVIVNVNYFSNYLSLIPGQLSVSLL